MDSSTIFVSVQPDSDYYVWQLMVQMKNFKKFGIENSAVVIFTYNPKTGVNKTALKFERNTQAMVLYFPDNRSDYDRRYISSVRPYALVEFYVKYSHLFMDMNIFYHDSDILFTELPEFDSLSKENKIIVSDTISYLGAKYVRSKGDELLNEMCSIVGIDPKVVINNEENTGGAQYFIPNTVKLSAKFWNKVKLDSVALYDHMNSTAHKYLPSNPIQAWTADMWALLWNFWLLGYESKISKELAFSWATDPIESWKTKKIYHNAGVTSDRKELFFKGNFMTKMPFGEDFSYVSERFCSKKYVEEIISTPNLH